MTENAKTGIFAGTATIVGLIAWITMPQQVTTIKDDSQQLVGKPMFEDFIDPTTASSLKIVKFDDNLGQLKPFELTRDKTNGAWVIPSHDSYPADAASQVSNVANSFIGLKILTVESTKADDQKLFGVVKPDISKLQVGDTGVGTLVEMKDDKGETLVDLVVGKTVRDDDKKRYVRRAGMDAIFTAEFDVKPITTDFSSWIEGDLLKLSSNDIAALIIRDYNILPNAGGPGQLLKNFDAELDYSPKDATWNAKLIRTYSNGTPSDRTLTDDEELNTVKINEIKNTLDNLKIVDVVRKPKGLAADLKADKELLDDNTKIMSLFKKGFVPAQRADGGLELYSTSGELAVKLNNGVEYLLRFGQSTAGDATDEEAEKDTTSGVALNRTLFVTARLDESHYPMPELQKVPETIEQLKELEAKEAPPAEPATNETTTPTEPSSAIESKPSNAVEGTPKAAIDTPTSTPSANEPATTSPEPPSASDVPKAADVPPDASTVPKGDQSQLDLPKLGSRLVRLQADEEAKAAQSEAAPAQDNVEKTDKSTEKKNKSAKNKKKSKEVSDTKDGDAVEKSEAVAKKESTDEKEEAVKKEADPKSDAATPSVEEKKVTDEKKAADDKKPTAETEEELKERLEAARERITKENTRALDERKDKFEEAKKKAGELNARFAEWYYEITDSEFKRLRASLDDLIKKKGSAGAAAPQDNNPGFPPGGGLPFNIPPSN